MKDVFKKNCFLIGGDINWSPSLLDTKNQSAPQWKFMSQNLRDGSFLDMYRHLNPTLLKFSHLWPGGKFSRIDHYITSPNLPHVVNNLNCDILDFLTDHAPITLHFDIKTIFEPKILNKKLRVRNFTYEEVVEFQKQIFLKFPPNSSYDNKIHLAERIVNETSKIARIILKQKPHKFKFKKKTLS